MKSQKEIVLDVMKSTVVATTNGDPFSVESDQQRCDLASSIIEKGYEIEYDPIWIDRLEASESDVIYKSSEYHFYIA